MPRSNPICILLIEDHVLVRNLISAILTRKGFLVLAAANTAEALELSRSCEGDLHLCLSRSKDVLKLEGHPKAQFVVITPAVFAEVTKGINEAGLCGIVHKPQVLATLLVDIERTLATSIRS